MEWLLTVPLTAKVLVPALLVFGFLPGFVLRLMVLIYPPGHPRRVELISELYVIPRWERPFWVFQQLEVVLWEGLPDRLFDLAAGRLIYRWKLTDGERRHQQNPESFEVPHLADRENLVAGQHVKLLFELRDGWGERMWVEVTGKRLGRYSGRLLNQPVGMPRPYYGQRVQFRARHVIDLKPPGNAPGAWRKPLDCDPEDNVQMLCSCCGDWSDKRCPSDEKATEQGTEHEG